MSYPGQVFEDPEYYEEPEKSEQDILDYLNEELEEVDEIYSPYYGA